MEIGRNMITTHYNEFLKDVKITNTIIKQGKLV